MAFRRRSFRGRSRTRRVFGGGRRRFRSTGVRRRGLRIGHRM